MIELVKELEKMINEGKLKIEGVTIDNHMREIELGSGTVEGFDGDIRLRVTSECDVIELGNRLGKAIQ